jgi:hypothetical protein
VQVVQRAASCRRHKDWSSVVGVLSTCAKGEPSGEEIIRPTRVMRYLPERGSGARQQLPVAFQEA